MTTLGNISSSLPDNLIVTVIHMFVPIVAIGTIGGLLLGLLYGKIVKTA